MRWADMDSFGHVNNVVFLRYLEEARSDLFFRAAREASVTGFSGGAVVARHEIDYKRPLTYRPEPVVVEMWVTRLGGASISVAYEIKDPPEPGEDGPGTVYARAATVIVPFDLERGTPRRLTRDERAFLEKYLDDDASAGASDAADAPDAPGVSGAVASRGGE
ncbi:acyl-CoA thioesterase [Streptomyces sp. 4N509B]|uniref:acyl-CoA thioesterase n=1 Tax=Streptomyces sp. 4N509B TaxID=3457413 RepID=UPI003FD35B21